MNRRLTMALLAALTTVGSPSVSSAACSSDLPVSDRRAATYSCDGVGPGMMLSIPSKKYGEMDCAASFAWADQFGRRYLTFPGHCYLDFDCLEDQVYDALPPPLDEALPRVPVCLMPGDSEEEPLHKSGGPAVRDLKGKRVGSIIYAVNKDDVDFALVRVDQGVRLDPALPFYGGPLRYAAAPSAVTETYVYSPQMFTGMPNATTGAMHGGPGNPHILTPRFGPNDIGASVMKPDGTAIGYLDGSISLLAGHVVKPIGPAISRAQRRTGLNLRLMTARLSSN